MDTVFLVGAGVMVIGFLVMLLLPHVELRKGSAYSERDAAEAGARTPECDAVMPVSESQRQRQRPDTTMARAQTSDEVCARAMV